MKVLKEERETVIIYDYQEKSWHIDTTVQKHIKKYRPFLKVIEQEEDNYLRGYFDTDQFNMSFSARKKQILNSEQRFALHARMRHSQP
ncbi:hypothetical protein [Oenococcus sp.]|uniref:hypothetical protein n=1 Tax=Oenococcus sp. TaxID=1979414 RepID=UPI0039EA6862